MLSQYKYRKNFTDMKEIALTGTNCHIFADVLSALLHRGIAVHAYVTYPERLMVEDVDLTVSRLAVDSPSTMHSDFEGYHDVVLLQRRPYQL